MDFHRKHQIMTTTVSITFTDEHHREQAFVLLGELNYRFCDVADVELTENNDENIETFTSILHDAIYGDAAQKAADAELDEPETTETESDPESEPERQRCECPDSVHDDMLPCPYDGHRVVERNGQRLVVCSECVLSGDKAINEPEPEPTTDQTPEPDEDDDGWQLLDDLENVHSTLEELGYVYGLTTAVREAIDALRTQRRRLRTLTAVAKARGAVLDLDAPSESLS